MAMAYGCGDCDGVWRPKKNAHGLHVVIRRQEPDRTSSATLTKHANCLDQFLAAKRFRAIICGMFVVYDVGWIQGSAIRRGVPVRMGLVWRADPGVTFVTARVDNIPSSVTRANHTRELRALDQAPYYETVEWMTLTADGPHEFFDLLLGYARFL
jgi:hypothetical protein